MTRIEVHTRAPLKPDCSATDRSKAAVRNNQSIHGRPLRWADARAGRNPAKPESLVPGQWTMLAVTGPHRPVVGFAGFYRTLTLRGENTMNRRPALTPPSFIVFGKTELSDRSDDRA